MDHTDPEILAMAAMGDSAIADSDLRHLVECPACAAELETLSHVTSVARSGSPFDEELAPPGPQVWKAISQTLGLAPEIEPAPFVVTRPAADAQSVGEHSAVRNAPSRHASVARARSRRRRPVILAAAAVLAVAATVAGVLVFGGNRSVGPSVVGTVTLAALPDWRGSSGRAVIEKTVSGERDVLVTVKESRPISGYQEVWLISADLTKLISVGILAGREGRFSIPADVNLKDYPIVDVSNEQPNGNPEHSGDSIVRGEFS